MARVPDLIAFCRLHSLRMLTVAELIRYRLQHERTVVRVAETTLPTAYGPFRMIAYENEVQGGESHVALVRGEVAQTDDPQAEPVLVRVHSHCLAGEVFGSTLCDCRGSVERSLRAIAEAGRGALVYLHNGSRGFELAPGAGPLAAIALHRDAPRSTAEPHEDRHGRILRQVGLGGQILSDLGIRRIRLLSNTRTHVPALQGFGVEIVEQVPIPESARTVVL